jgi:hypothetical protein
MIAARCVKQQRLADRVPALAVAVEQQPPDVLRAGRAAGLASALGGDAGARQRGDEQASLGRLTGALAAFDRDEAAAQCRLPQIMWPATAATRPTGPSRSTLAAVTSGASTGGVSGAVTTILPASCPFSTGAVTGWL